MRRSYHGKNIKKPKTAIKLRRFKCAICRKRGKEQVLAAPYYCPKCKKEFRDVPGV